MFHCTFDLNAQPLSALKLNGWAMPAFSGRAALLNMKGKSSLLCGGPIPSGTYWVIDAPSASPSDDGLALYPAHGRMDDQTFHQHLGLGRLRLRPKGPQQRGDGCIVIDQRTDYFRLLTLLSAVQPSPIPGSELLARGRLTVR